MDFPHYELVPKDIDANLRWRRDVLMEAAGDESFAASMKAMCSEDCLFYMNAFCWTYDPRDTKAPNKPFITYAEFQDEAIEGLLEGVERGFDIAWPKSRTMGASWLGLTGFEWLWHFRDYLSFLLISRNEDYVDKKGNPKTLFWKIDFLHQNQPRWLLPTGRWLGSKDPNRKLLHLGNADTNSVIDGESTTGDAARGDRRTAMFIDEHAAFEVSEGYKALKASRDTTRCRVFNSTPQGAANAFYEVVHNTSAKVYRMHWSKHPVYNRGLYISEKDKSGKHRLKHLDNFRGKVVTQRKEWHEPREMFFPDDYPFILDGKMRSPWYDGECSRCASEQEIAQELDIDFLGSDYQFFDPEFITILIAEYCMPPTMVGRLIFDPLTLEPEGFMPDPKGPLQLWFNLTGSEEVLTDREYLAGRQFGSGSDVSFGTGASNSATAIVDLATGRKVARWMDPHTAPYGFADEQIALAKWFNNAFMIWDASGASGRSFTKRVIEQKYRRIYYRKDEERSRSRITDKPGFYLNPEDRAVLLRDYRKKLQDREYINVSEPGMRECLQFVVQPGGKVEHSAAANSQDPRGAREAHGDEAIADALASRILAMRSVEAKPPKREAPYMSVAWRLQQEEQAAEAAAREDW